MARLVPVVEWTGDDDHGSTAIRITVAAERLINPLLYGAHRPNHARKATGAEESPPSRVAP